MQDELLSNVTIKAIAAAPLEELRTLYIQADWWKSSYGDEPEFLHHIVKKSACFMGAFMEKKLIGMGRALSDGISDAYIQDVTVLKAYRGHGIGKKIIQALVTRLKENGVDWIGLVAEPGTDSFYKSLGFEVLKDHIALRYKDV